MTLSEIIAYKNLLDSLTPLEAIPLAHTKLRPILNIVTNNEIQLPRVSEQLTTDYNYVLQTLGDFESTVEKIKVSLQIMVDQNNAEYYAQSTKNYNESREYEITDVVLGRELSIFKEINEKLLSRLRFYNTWRYSGMIVRPGHESWINELVGCDPLYIVDHSTDLLEPAKLRFNDQYRNRLRTYVISEDDDIPIFNQLPDGQLGFCLIYNFFNYKPLEVIKRYIKELFDKLKPGGVIAMTFNDCERAEGAKLFEQGFMSYTPGSQVFSWCSSLGYEIIDKFRIDHSCTWMEIKRPGEITSLRGGQSLAKILYKDEEFLYTNEEKKNIRTIAADLNIDTGQALDLMPIGQVIKLINQRKL